MIVTRYIVTKTSNYYRRYVVGVDKLQLDYKNNRNNKTTLIAS